MTKQTVIVITVSSALIAGLLGFFGGMFYSRGRIGTQFGNRVGRFGNYPNDQVRGTDGTMGAMVKGAGGLGSGFGMRGVAGEIMSVDGDKITVKMPDNSSKLVIVTSATTINKSVNATKSDLARGATVRIFGTTSSDGSVSAQNVQTLDKSEAAQ